MIHPAEYRWGYILSSLHLTSKTASCPSHLTPNPLTPNPLTPPFQETSSTAANVRRSIDLSTGVARRLKPQTGPPMGLKDERGPYRYMVRPTRREGRRGGYLRMGMGEVMMVTGCSLTYRVLSGTVGI